MKNKPQMSRLRKFRRTLEAVVRVLEHGEEKHENDLGWTEYPIDLDLDAIGRHWLKTPDIDEDTEESHLINLICRAMFAHEKWLYQKEQITKITYKSTFDRTTPEWYEEFVSIEASPAQIGREFEKDLL